MLSRLSLEAFRLVKVLKIVGSELRAVCPFVQVPAERPISTPIFARFLPAFDLRVAVFGRIWMSPCSREPA